jgi:Fur family ferric uptake transcriptional regulator
MRKTTALAYDELLKKFKTLLRENGLKFTAQREAILQTLYENPNHFTPENLYLLVKQNYPDLSTGITTVYRTLNLLEENGLVTSISLGIQGKKFEIANKPIMIISSVQNAVKLSNLKMKKSKNYKKTLQINMDLN